MLSRLVLNLRSLSVAKDMNATVSTDVVFRNPALHGTFESQHSTMSQRSFWGKTMDDLADKSIGSSSIGRREVMDLHATQDLGDDIPLQQMEIPHAC